MRVKNVGKTEVMKSRAAPMKQARELQPCCGKMERRSRWQHGSALYFAVSSSVQNPGHVHKSVCDCYVTCAPKVHRIVPGVALPFPQQGLFPINVRLASPC